MEKTYSIYALVCPLENVIKYVGCSLNPEQRLKSSFNSTSNSNKKNIWFKMLKSKNLKPIIKILDTTTIFEEAIIKEQNFINIHRQTILNHDNPILYRKYTSNRIKKINKHFRTSETFLQLIKKVSEKKEMSMTETIEHLVRFEAEKLKIK